MTTGGRQEFSAAAFKRITEALRAAPARRDWEDEELGGGEEDTWVVPLVQMKPLGIRVDERVTQVSEPLSSSRARQDTRAISGGFPALNLSPGP